MGSSPMAAADAASVKNAGDESPIHSLFTIDGTIKFQSVGSSEEASVALVNVAKLELQK